MKTYLNNLWNKWVDPPSEEDVTITKVTRKARRLFRELNDPSHSLSEVEKIDAIKHLIENQKNKMISDKEEVLERLKELDQGLDFIHYVNPVKESGGVPLKKGINLSDLVE